MRNIRLNIFIFLVVCIPAAQARVWDVSIVNFAFNPQNITVTQGDSVRWTNNSGSPHTVTANGGAFNSGTISPGQNFVFVFSTLGSFAYHCASHPSMTGSVTVQSGPVITITEVMYDDTASTDLEWVEIHNTTGAAIDISGWVLIDATAYPAANEGSLLVPASTLIQPDEYLVLCKLDISEFPGELVCTQNFGTWGLGNSGDNLALFTAASGGTLVDGALGSNFYPDLATGNAGNSIEKCDANAAWDSSAAAWHESTNNFATTGRYRHITPGAANSPCAGDVDPPILVSIQAGANPVIDVTFSEALDPVTANNNGNYVVDNGIGNPASATLQGNPAIVRLVFAAELPPNSYILTVNNVEDLAGNPIAPNSTIPFTIEAVQYDMRFTEFMPNPNFAGTGDSLGEWFEIYNAGDAAVDLSGWIIQDNAGSDTIEAGTINSGQYFVFCSNGDSTTNGGVPENYAYEFGTSGWGISLNNTGEPITLRTASGSVVATLSYAGFPFAAGFSAQLRNLNDDPTLPANWCQADTVWVGANNGDHGTPGAATICPAPFVPDTITVCVIRQQDTCGVPLRLGDRVVTHAVVSWVDTCRPIAYVQSGDCAVSIFGPAVTNVMQNHTRHMLPGDSVRIEGYITQFRGLTEFSTFANFVPVISYIALVPVPENDIISCLDISVDGAACAGEAYESRQVRVEGVTFANGGGTFTHGDSSYAATCSGGQAITFFVDSCDAVFGTIIPTGPVTVNAIAAQYDTTTGCYCRGYQLIYGGGQTFISGPCVDPVELTVYRTVGGAGTESVELQWQPGAGQTCNCYRIYYTTNADAAFPGDYTLLHCGCGTTSYVDVVPISTTPKRFYVVTADSSCP